MAAPRQPTGEGISYPELVSVAAARRYLRARYGGLYRQLVKAAYVARLQVALPFGAMRELTDLLPEVLAQLEQSQRLCLQAQSVVQRLGGAPRDLRRIQRVMRAFDPNDPRALRAMQRLSVRSSFEMTIAALTAERLTEVEAAIGSARAMLALTATFWAEVPRKGSRRRDFKSELHAARSNLEQLAQFWAVPKKRRPGRPVDPDAGIASIVDCVAWAVSGERLERLDMAAVAIVAGIEEAGPEHWRRSCVTRWGNFLRAHRTSGEKLADFAQTLPPQAQSIVDGMRREVRAVRASAKKNSFSCDRF